MIAPSPMLCSDPDTRAWVTESHIEGLKIGAPMWTIYEHPTDQPDHFVARMFIAAKGTAYVTLTAIMGETLAEVRAALPPGLYCMPRLELDEPQIVEVWI